MLNKYFLLSIIADNKLYLIKKYIIYLKYFHLKINVVIAFNK